MVDTVTETWLPVPGFQGHYSVSDHGHVRSDQRRIDTSRGLWRQDERILKPYVSGPLGHLKVDLYLNGKRYKRYVYRLMLEAFVGPCPPGMQALHGDDDRSNNWLTNLRWGTQSENNRDSIRNGNNHESNKTRCKWGHGFTPDNTAWRRNGK